MLIYNSKSLLELYILLKFKNENLFQLEIYYYNIYYKNNNKLKINKFL